MAGSVNKVMLMGNLTRDIELKHLTSGQVVGSFGIAVNRRYKTKDGETREEVAFIDCEAWARTAEVMSQYLSKGRPVFIEGRLKLDQWEAQDGTKRSKLKVVVEQFQFVDSREGGGNTSGGNSDGGERASASAPVASASAGQSQPISEADIPFAWLLAGSLAGLYAAADHAWAINLLQAWA